MFGQAKRPFDDDLEYPDLGTWSSPADAAVAAVLGCSLELTRSDSLQSLNDRANDLDIGSSWLTESDGRLAGSKRAKVVETIELSDTSDDDDDDDDLDVIIVDPGRTDSGERNLVRENLGPWWDSEEMNKRRHHFLLAHVELYSALLPNDSGYFAKLVDSHRRTGVPLPTSPAVPYRRLSQPPLIAKNAVMKDYQLSGLSFLAFCAENRINAILADEMGLGKTLQTLSLIAYLAEAHGAKGPHLLICPLSVLSSWMNEIARWLPAFKAMRFHGTQPARALLKDECNERAPDLVVATYESFAAEQVFFKNRKTWGLCVLDEGHRIKNAESLVSVAIKGIRAQMRLILSGTPVQNNLVELWSLLHFLDPLVFHEKTVQPFKSSFDLTFGNYNQQFLRDSQKFLELVMLRRTKEGVSSQLTVPPREEHTIYVPLSPAQRFWTKALLARTEANLLAEIFSDYEAQTPLTLQTGSNRVKTELGTGGGGGAEIIYLDAVDDGETQVRANVRRAIEASKQTSSDSGGSGWKKLMNLLIQLRKTCNHPYLLPDAESEPFEVAEHIVVASSKLVLLDKLLATIVPRGEKVLIFSGFTSMLDILEDFMHLRGYKYCRLDGKTSRPRRTLDIRLFQQADSPYQIYLISTKAGGLGIILTAATTVVLYDQDWNPQVDLQAIARAHRIGQERTVRVYKLVGQDSVEEQMLTRLRKKLYLSAKVMGAMRNVNERARAAADGGLLTQDESTQQQEEAPKMTRGELAGILRGGAGSLGRWTNSDGSDPFDTFKASTFDEIIERGKARDETKEVGIKLELGEVELSQEQKMKLEREEEEAEALLLAGREAVRTRQFQGKLYTASNKDIRQEWQDMQGKQTRLDKSRTVMIGGFAIARESINNQRWEAVKTITSDPLKLQQLQNKKRAKKQIQHEDWCIWCRDGGEIYECRTCPRVAHGPCTGLSAEQLKRMTYYVCPQHNCCECRKTTGEAGGLLFRCQLCPLAFCEDCLPPGDLESVGDVLPELLVLGYGKNPQAHFIKCSGCLEHFREHPAAERQWRTEQDKIEAKARKMGYRF
ncbi:hypothetical protein JCM11491_004237 [Sporobolomyces phaffii]